MNEAVGAFMACAALITLFGVTGWFERVMNRIPVAIASALLAGVLARFGLQAFMAAQTALPLVVLMLLSYLLMKRLIASLCSSNNTFICYNICSNSGIYLRRLRSFLSLQNLCLSCPSLHGVRWSA